MKFSTCIAKRFPKGLFIAAAAAILDTMKSLSLSRALAHRLSKGAGPAPGKVHAWLGDAYVTLCLCAEIVLAVLATDASLPGWLRWSMALLVGYRLFELGVFLLSWLLVDAGPLHSYRRSIISFSINIAEVALLSTILDALVPCGSLQGFSAFWSHVSAMISLDGGDVLTRHGVCRAVSVVRFGFGVILMLLALATLAGGLIRAEIEHKPGGTPGG